MSRYAGLWVVVGVILCAPSAIFAQVTPPLSVSPGCRIATAQDQAQRAARGIPPAFQVCPGDEQILGIGENFDQWYAQLRGQSPCNRNTCTLSCRTRNTGAQVCGPTASRWNSLGCHPNNNTAIFPSVAYGFAAHIELLRRYCGERGRCTIAQVQQTWSTANQGTYAAFVSRMAGIPVNQVFDPNDINLVGRLALAMSCFEAGAMPYDVNELKQGLAMAAGGQRMPVPGNVGQLLQESLIGSYAPNPAGSTVSGPGSWAYPPQNLNGNNNYVPMPTQPNPWQSQPTGSPGSTNTQNPYSPNTSAPVQGAGSALNIIVWPHTVLKGQTAMVYWTSVNMAQTSCTVLFQDQQFANSNEGVKPFKTTSFDPGQLTFTLQCTDGTGVQRRVSDTAILQ